MTAVSEGTWAVTPLTTGQFAPSPTCGSLPRLQGETISGWDWAGGPAVSFCATDDGSGAAVGTEPCR